MRQTFSHINKVKGELSLKGDKSISHRVLIISSLAKGKSKIFNLPESDDIKSTIYCLKELGVRIELSKEINFVSGNGFKGLKQPTKNLNAGDSGTTARLLSGILIAQKFDSVLEGGSSLSSRPMDRIVEPLRLMGGEIKAAKNGTMPLKIMPSNMLRAISYEMPVASAQVKSAVIFAGLHIEEETEIIESVQTRNHTENLLNLPSLEKEGKIISKASVKNYPESNEYFIPGDISSAMYFIVLTLLAKNSELVLRNISLNESRTAVIDLLKSMGAKIEIDLKGESNREKYGDIIVRSSELVNIPIEKSIVPMIIDEIPILTVAGLLAKGEFVIRNAAELRIKESDRIKTLCLNLALPGLMVQEFEDGFSIGGKIKYCIPRFNSLGDHRIAMALSVLSCLLKGGGEVEGVECVSKSNPDFLNQLNQIIH